MRNYFLSLLVMLIPVSAQCYDDIALDKIVVTPSRTDEYYSETARKIDIISTAKNGNYIAPDVSYLLDDLSSVNISNYGGAAGIKTLKMRGSSGSQVLVMVDGRPINSPRDGEIDLRLIPVDNIERMEILHGPASSLYGSQAMGGAVNIITKSPPAKGSYTELQSLYGTYYSFNNRFTNAASQGKFGYVLSGGYAGSQGLRDNNESEIKDINLKTEYKLDNDSFSTSVGFLKERAGTPGMLSSPDLDDRQDTRKEYLDFSWKHKFTDRLKITTRIYDNYEHLQFRENSVAGPFDTQNAVFNHYTQSRGIDLQANQEFSDMLSAVYGFNRVDNWNNSSSSGKHKYNVNAAFLEVLAKLTEKLKLTLGSRVDDYSNFGNSVNPSASASYRFNDLHLIKGTISRSFRAPTFNDLFWPDEGWAKGNPDLKPEKGVTGEVGYDFQYKDKFNASISYYRSKYSQLINWVEKSFVWMPENVGSALMDGIELDGKVSLDKKTELGSSYTYLKARDRKTKKYLVYQPKNKADLYIKWKNIAGFSLKIKAQFVSGRFHDPENNVKVKPFATAGVGVSKTLGSHTTLIMEIDNILNRKYQAVKDYPMQGFSITGGVKIKF